MFLLMYPWRTLGLLSLAVLIGCSSKDWSDLVGAGAKKVEKASSRVIEAVKSPLSLSGSIALVIARPIDTDRCYATLTPLSAGRPSVLQLASHRTIGEETFPSIFFRAAVSGRSAKELVGQTIRGDLFVQPAKDGPIWHSVENQPIELKVTKVEDHSLTAEVIKGSAVHTETQFNAEVRGTFAAVFD